MKGFFVRCFFHVSYGKMAWDSEGIELQDLAEARSAAVKLSGALLSDLDDGRIWRGIPWRLWVTEGPNGTGNTVLALSFVADYGALGADPHAHNIRGN
jgi:hypothetical protein